MNRKQYVIISSRNGELGLYSDVVKAMADCNSLRRHFRKVDVHFNVAKRDVAKRS